MKKTSIAPLARAIAAAMLIAGCGGPQAQQTQAQQGGVTDEHAREVALQHAPGSTVVRVEHEGQAPNAIIEVVLRQQDGTLAAAEVDGQSGAFLRMEPEDDDHDGEVDEHAGGGDHDGEVDEHASGGDHDGEVDEHASGGDHDGEVDEHTGARDADGDVDEDDEDGEADEHAGHAQP